MGHLRSRGTAAAFAVATTLLAVLAQHCMADTPPTPMLAVAATAPLPMACPDVPVSALRL